MKVRVDDECHDTKQSESNQYSSQRRAIVGGFELFFLILVDWVAQQGGPSPEVDFSKVSGVERILSTK